MSGLLVGIDDAQVLDANITLPYTLTTGPAAGTYLAELANRRIVGTRADAVVSVPPQDYPGGLTDVETEWVAVPQTGTVSAWTRTPDGAVATIRLDGVDTDFLHRIVGDDSGLANGVRVTAAWADAAGEDLTSLALQLDGFAVTPDAPAAGQVETITPAEPLKEVPYSLSLDFQHSYGQFYGRMFDELATSRRIVGSKCPRCLNVLVPARGNCDACFVPTAQTLDVADTGTILGFSVIHLEFVGQKRKPPYVYAEINLDGTATRLIHNVGGVDMAKAEELLDIGTRVRAVWRDQSPGNGTLDDIEYFTPIENE
ncbi:MAG: OB-fold domain-containing protein [Sporichthyaceae bacterium]